MLCLKMTLWLVYVQGFDAEKGRAIFCNFKFPHSVIFRSMRKSIETDLMGHIQQCYDKVCVQHNNVMDSLKSIHDKIEEGGSGNGISEKTLLDALRIVHSSHD